MLGKGPAGPCKAPIKEESMRLRGKGDTIKFVDLRFEREEVVGFGKGRRRQDVP